MTSANSEWRRLGSVPLAGGSGIDWQGALARRRCDPYLAWEDLRARPSTRSSSTSARPADVPRAPWVTVIVQWASAASANRRSHERRLQLELTHGHAREGAGHVRLYRCRLEHLKGLMDSVGGPVLRFEIEQAMSYAEVAEQAELRRAASAAPRPAAAVPTRKTGRETQVLDAAPLIGVIDDTLNFRHPRWVRTSYSGRHPVLRLLWDQSDLQADAAAPRDSRQRGPERGSGPGPSVEWVTHAWGDGRRPMPGAASPRAASAPMADGPSYGRELDGAALRTLAEAEEADLRYAPFEYPRVIERRRQEAPPSQRVLPMREWSHGVAVASTIDDCAGGLPADCLMFVSLPAASTEDTTASSLAGFVLDGLRHMIQAAGKRPLVVNLSYGTHQGPHDGTSLFETGLAELLHAHKNLHVVMPAGNSHLLRTHRQAMLAPGQAMQLDWHVLPGVRTDRFLEIWCHEQGDWSVQVQPPGAHAPLSPEVPPGEGQYWVLRGDQGNEVARAALIFPIRPAQGLHGSMALMAVGPTFAPWMPGLRPAAPHGIWRVTVKNRGPSTRSFHAWILRDDAAPGGLRAARGIEGRQSYFLDSEAARPEPCSTISGIATLDPTPFEGRLLIVGALRDDDGGLSVYSAAGPTLDLGCATFGPNIVVPADQSMNRPGLLVAGTFGRAKRRYSGTSIAAAKVSAFLFKHLSRGGRADTFWAECVATPTTRPVVDVGAPAHADVHFRGEAARVRFPRDDLELTSLLKGRAPSR